MFECVICYDEFEKDYGIECLICKKKVCCGCLEKLTNIEIEIAFEEFSLTPKELDEQIFFPKCPVCRSKMYNHGFGFVLCELEELFIELLLIEEQLEEVFF